MLEELSDLSGLSVEEYLRLDDYEVWCMMKRSEKARWAVERIERRRIPKVAFELRLSEEDIPKSILRDPENVKLEIASLSGIPENAIWVDTPYVTPLPFKDESRVEFFDETSGKPRPVEYSSPLLEFTSKIYGMIRVYADPEHLERVRKASEKYFGDVLSPSS